jgi:hypothetical protein
MYITKENVTKIIQELQLENFNVYVDMKFFLKDICNPYRTSFLKFMDKIDVHKYFIDLHSIMTSLFKTQVFFVYSTDKIEIEGMPSYKSVYYSKYFDDIERNEILYPAKSVFEALKHTSINADDMKFVDSSDLIFSLKDEFGFIKDNHENKKALVITRDKIFCGYEDMVVIDPYDVSTGEIKQIKVPDYYKIILSIIGYDEYSIPGIPGIKEKTAEKIINKVIDSGEYIYYNKTSRSQPIFPISYEILNKVSDITREEYDIILTNWKFLN